MIRRQFHAATMPLVLREHPRAAASKPRLFFLGSSSYALAGFDACLEFAHRHHGELAAVFCSPRKEENIFGKPKADEQPVADKARGLGIRVIESLGFIAGGDATRGAACEMAQRAFSEGCDVAVASAYGYMIPPHLLTIPRLGCITLHPSLLPAYRGGAPIHWVIANGERYTGVSTIRMDEQFDTGPLMLQKEIEIGEDEDTPHLRRRLRTLGVEVLLETLERLFSDRLELRPQLRAFASLAPKVKPQDGVIDWNWDAAKIRNRVRAMRPWPGTETAWGEKRLRISRATLTPLLCAPETFKPGTVHHIDPQKGIFVVCGDRRSILLEGLNLAGEPMDRAHLLDHLQLKIGHRLGGHPPIP